MDQNLKNHVFVVPRVIYAPVILSCVVLALTLLDSAWMLDALPFVWLGASGAAPNLNLANGCMAYLAMIAGCMILIFHAHECLGILILVGAASGYYTGVLEQRIRMRPFDKNASCFRGRA